MDATTYNKIQKKIADEIKNSDDPRSAEQWSECLKNVAIAFSIDTDRGLKQRN